MSALRVSACLAICAAIAMAAGPSARTDGDPATVLADHLLVTWYGNPHTPRMGVLGQRSGAALAAALRQQAAEYAPFTTKKILMAYHLVAVIAQPAPGRDGQYRRRESAGVIWSLLDEARRNDFRLVLDVQPGRSPVIAEVTALRPFLAEPDVYLALDPEFAMSDPDVPGRKIGAIRAADINAVIDFLEKVIVEARLPPKVLIVHQFRWDMLPDKTKVKTSALVDIALVMDGIGAQALKLATYRANARQGLFEFAGFKLFYQQDTQIFSPSQVMALKPVPSVVIYQ